MLVSLSRTNMGLCVSSSEFLCLAARVCFAARQWAFCHLLAFKALCVNNFKSNASKHYSLTLFAFTAGYDMFARQQGRGAESRFNQLMSWFDEAVAMDTADRPIGTQAKREFLMLLSGYTDLTPTIKSVVIQQLSSIRSLACSSFLTPVASRVASLKNTDHRDWVPQVDAGEVGNEARYANHADYPNGILVKRCNSYCPTRMCGKCTMVPHLVALRDIEPGDEITVNYGSSYWKKIKPGSDPILLGHVLAEPFSDCVYYDGVVEDFSGGSVPGGFLLPPRNRTRNPNLLVDRVAKDHPAYPGFGLFAKNSFKRGDIVCIYGGIVDTSPHSGRHHSKYIVDLSGDPAVGPFSFSFDPVSLLPVAEQRYLPYLTDFGDISIARRTDEVNLVDSITKIGLLDADMTKTIVTAIMTPGLRPLVVKKLGGIKVLFDNGNKRDQMEWLKAVKRAFGDILSIPKPLPIQSSYENELIVMLES